MGVQAEEQVRVWVTMDQVHHSWNSVMCLSVFVFGYSAMGFFPYGEEFFLVNRFFLFTCGVFSPGF